MGINSVIRRCSSPANSTYVYTPSSAGSGAPRLTKFLHRGSSWAQIARPKAPPCEGLSYFVVGACAHLGVCIYTVGARIPFRLVSDNFCTARGLGWGRRIASLRLRSVALQKVKLSLHSDRFSAYVCKKAAKGGFFITTAFLSCRSQRSRGGRGRWCQRTHACRHGSNGRADRTVPPSSRSEY